MTEPKTLNDQELKTALDASPSPNRLTPEYIEAQIVDAEYLRRGNAIIGIFTLANGCILTGIGGAIDPANFNEEIGRTVARRNALNEIWAREGYHALKVQAANA